MYSMLTSVCGEYTENLVQQSIFAADFGAFVFGVVQHLAIHVAKDIVPHPAHHFQVAGGEHKTEAGSQAGSLPFCRRDPCGRFHARAPFVE